MTQTVPVTGVAQVRVSGSQQAVLTAAARGGPQILKEADGSWW